MCINKAAIGGIARLVGDVEVVNVSLQQGRISVYLNRGSNCVIIESYFSRQLSPSLKYSISEQGTGACVGLSVPRIPGGSRFSRPISIWLQAWVGDSFDHLGG